MPAQQTRTNLVLSVSDFSKHSSRGEFTGSIPKNLAVYDGFLVDIDDRCVPGDAVLFSTTTGLRVETLVGFGPYGYKDGKFVGRHERSPGGHLIGITSFGNIVGRVVAKLNKPKRGSA
jgi:hypothetical protein